MITLRAEFVNQVLYHLSCKSLGIVHAVLAILFLQCKVIGMLRTVAVTIDDNDITLKFLLLDTMYRCLTCSALSTKQDSFRLTWNRLSSG